MSYKKSGSKLLFQFIDIFFQIYMLMLFVRIMGSWVPEWQNNRFMQFIGFYTDPYLNIFRRFIPPLGMMDISPIVAFFCLSFLKQGLKLLILTLLR